MAFNDYISREDAAALINEKVSPFLLETVPQTSAVMRMCRMLTPMSSKQTKLPIPSTLPTAHFVSEDALQQTSDVSWVNRFIQAEELAVDVPIPKALLEDADYDIIGYVKPMLNEAFAVAIDDAVINGTNMPSAWATNFGTTTTAYAGLVARATAASQVISLAAYVDAYEAINGKTPAGARGLRMLLEEDGFIATGGIGHTDMAGEVRNCRDLNGNPIFVDGSVTSSQYTNGSISGIPTMFPLTGILTAASCLYLVGMWDKLVGAIRRDITYEITDQGVLSDSQGKIVRNMRQQRELCLTATMRLGFALPNPLNRANKTELTRCPFAVLTS